VNPSPNGKPAEAPPLSALFNLQGRRALVTGGAQGIGLALARGLAEAGAELVLNDREPEKLDSAVSALRSAGFKASGAAFDVANETDVRAAVACIEEGVGPVDILVNNAGIHRRAPLVDMRASDWQAVMDVNLKGAFLVAAAVAPGMIRRRAGKVINICSLNSEIVRPGIANYAAAKGGLKMLTRAMAVEWGSHNIQANGIGPGYLLTELTQQLADDAQFDAWIKARTPAGRWGSPRDLLGAAVFLASPASDFVNGHILYVDGGLLASL